MMSRSDDHSTFYPLVAGARTVVIVGLFYAAALANMQDSCCLSNEKSNHFQVQKKFVLFKKRKPK
jgi:hypothetical protein